jgi:citrate lyase subunit beta/citryl-CoA lyase
LAIANAVFSPSPEEVAYFTGMLAAMKAAEARGDGAVRYRGFMIDYAMLPTAEEVVCDAERWGIKAAPTPEA